MPKLNKETKKFQEAILFGEIDKAKALYEAGKVDLEAADGDNATVLHMSVAMGQLELTQWLIDKGSNVHARKVEAWDDEYGSDHESTVLMSAAGAFHAGAHAVAIVRSLLAAGADINAVDHEGKTALFYALEFPDVVEALIEASIDINRTNKNGSSALMLAKQMPSPKVVELLESAGASTAGLLNVELMEAAAYGMLERVLALIEQGADIDFRDDGTALSAAAGAGHGEVVRALLSAGADPNILESDAKSGDFGPLSRAVYSGHLEIARTLIAAGADPTASNHGISVLDYAKLGKREGHDKDKPWDEMIKLVRKANEAEAKNPAKKGTRTV